MGWPSFAGPGYATKEDLRQLISVLKDGITVSSGGSGTTVTVTGSAAFDDTVGRQNIEPDDSDSSGTSGFAARTDHRHAVATEAPASPSVQPTSSAEGSGTNFARADHTHQAATAAPAADSVSLSASGEGTATTYARSDHTHQLDEAIVPTWTGIHTFNDRTDTSTLKPRSLSAYDVGTLASRYLRVYAGELWVETLVAQNTLATIGGRILVGPTTKLKGTVADVSTSISVEHNSLAIGDILFLEEGGELEFMEVTAGPTGAGPYSYTVTRNLDGTGANAWLRETAVFNTGAAGDGFLDIYSVRGVKSASQAGPTIVGNVRNSATYNDWTEHWAIGNLNNLYDYGVDTYGFAAGKYSTTTSWLAADATNGIRMMRGTTKLAQWDVDGNILVGQASASQSNVYITAGAVYLRNNTTNLLTLDTSGNILVGQTGAGQSNTYITAGALYLRNNATALVTLDTSGNILVGQTGASQSNVYITSGAIQLRNNTTSKITLAADGSASFDGVINIGTSGGIFQGTGSFATPTTALKIYNSGGIGLWELWGSGTKQVYAGTDGKLYAGGGDVELNADGLILNGEGYPNNAVTWKYIGTTTAEIWSTTGAGTNNLWVQATATTGEALAEMIAKTTTYTAYWAVRQDEGASSGLIAGSINGVQTFQITNDHTCSIAGYFYPGAGSATQATRYLYDDGTRSKFSGGLAVAGDLTLGTQGTWSEQLLSSSTATVNLNDLSALSAYLILVVEKPGDTNYTKSWYGVVTHGKQNNGGLYDIAGVDITQLAMHKSEDTLTNLSVVDNSSTVSALKLQVQGLDNPDATTSYVRVHIWRLAY